MFWGVASKIYFRFAEMFERGFHVVFLGKKCIKILKPYFQRISEPNTCFGLKKNGQNRRSNLGKCAVSGCIRKGPEWFFQCMHFYEGPDDF